MTVSEIKYYRIEELKLKIGWRFFLLGDAFYHLWMALLGYTQVVDVQDFDDYQRQKLCDSLHEI